MSFWATDRLSTQILYCYLNSTHKIQLVCLVNSRGMLMEKVVFPQQKILFEGILEGRLEVYVEKNGKKVLQKIIYCQPFPALKRRGLWLTAFRGQNLAIAKPELQSTAI